jgi:hypothetical protein
MNDLERAYATLAQEADTVLLTSSEVLRGRADRRTRIRFVAGCAVLALVIGGTTVGARWALQASGPPQGPAATPSGEGQSPAPTASASTSPATTATPTNTAAPKQGPVPDRAFLQLADTNGDERPTEVSGENMLPSLCGAKFPSDSSILTRRTMHITYWKSRQPAGTLPDGTFDETITSYRSDGAVQFIAQLRAAVATCATETSNGTTYKHRLISGSKHGDESILIERRYPARNDAGELVGGDEVRLVSVVRIGNVVMTLYEQGWEAGWTAEPAVVDTFTRTAVTRLRSWLG